jgi:ATP-dependent DNA helicase RecQ
MTPAAGRGFMMAGMSDRLAEARELLGRHFGYAEFRPAQTRVLCSLFEGKDVLAVLPTGGGKSICFQIPAMVYGGLTVVVSPLISLMQDQVAAAVGRGIPSACLNSVLELEEQRRVWSMLRGGGLRLLYVSPERLERLAPELRSAGIRPSLLAIDEAHCIAEWGHDFRPSYRGLRAARYRLGTPRTIALTGSATPEVRQEIVHALGLSAGRYRVHVASFDRPNLWFGVVRVRSEEERLAALRALIAWQDQMAIVYTPTRGVTESVAAALKRAGHRSAPYHAGLSKQRRAATLDSFLTDRIDVVVATCAFGMGIDKPTVRLVVHWSLPATPESYYQEAGRAGRDGEFARCVLLWRDGDADLPTRQLDVTFPPARLLERLWADGHGKRKVPRNVRESAERLRRELRPEHGPVDWSRVRARRKRAEARIAVIDAYARRSECRRRRLIGYFGEPLSRCAGCDHCSSALPPAPKSPAARERLERLVRSLRGARAPWGGAPIEPAAMLGLAADPPANAGALADRVGPRVAERWGGAILSALQQSGQAAEPARSLPQSPLAEWRRAVAQDMAVPEYTILGDSALRALETAPPSTREALGRVAGFGPRLLAKFGGAIFNVVRRRAR